MIELMDISESIYEVVVETSYKKPTMADANCAKHRRQKRGEAASSQTHSVMGDIYGRLRKQYVYCPSGEL